MTQPASPPAPSGQDFFFRPGKMLICLIGRHKGEALVAITKAVGARGGTITFGRSVGDNRFLQALSLADVAQDVVITLLGPEADAVIDAVRQAKKLKGLAVVLDVAGTRMRVRPGEARPSAAESRSMPMESGYVLITVIVNNGYADDVMAQARKAGAAGGTIINARGTGTEEDVKFFGITLVPEKEMLYIVTPRDKSEAILAAVNTIPNLCEPGGGIVYCTNVEDFIILGE